MNLHGVFGCEGSHAFPSLTKSSQTKCHLVFVVKWLIFCGDKLRHVHGCGLL